MGGRRTVSPEKRVLACFEYLVETAADDKNLGALAGEATRVRKRGPKQVFDFAGGCRLVSRAPAPAAERRHWQRSFQNSLMKHRAIEFGAALPGISTDSHLWLGVCNNFESDYREEIDSPLLKHTSHDEVLCPLGVGPDWWVFHPVKADREGRPVLVFVSHEGPMASRSVKATPGSLFLSLAVEFIRSHAQHSERMRRLAALPKYTKEQARERGQLDALFNELLDAVYKAMRQQQTQREAGRLVARANGLIERYSEIYRPRISRHEASCHDGSVHQLQEWIDELEKRWRS
jgi:hypothetical protein